MEFKEAIKKLGIEEYSKRIFNSNSHGELFHLYGYIQLAELVGDNNWFKGWLDSVVKWAEDNWDRPESVFQHIPKLLWGQTHNPALEPTNTTEPKTNIE